MSQSSFEIKTAMDLYQKLVREHERLSDNLWSSDHAINFGITAHHLFKDWLKRELSIEDYTKLKAQVDINLKMEMEIIRDVCDGAKHLQLNKPPHIQISDSGKHQGAYSKGFDRGFDIGGLFLILHDGSEIYFDNVADKVVGFWKNYFNENYRTPA